VNAKSIEELHVYQKALKAADAVSAILKRPCFNRDARLREQLGASSGAVPAHMAEGFGLSTDRLFAQCLYRSRGESKETRAHLLVARGRDYVAADECNALCAAYEEIERMTTSLISHLKREDRRDRG